MSDTKYFNCTFDVNEDSDVLENLEILKSIGRYKTRDIVLTGISSLMKSSDFKTKVKELKDKFSS